MKITFLLWSTAVSGGLRYIYEVANNLIDRGHKVRLLSFRLPYERLTPNGKPTWFTLNTNIKRESNVNRLIQSIPESDITVATYWLTAEWLSQAGSQKGIPFYLIQNYEAWLDEVLDPKVRKNTFVKLGFNNISQERVKDTYKLPFKLIVVSTWLKNLLAYRYSRQVEVVAPGGVNPWHFSANENLVKTRRIAAFYKRGHGQPRRGINFLLDALKPIDDVKKIDLAGSDAELANLYRSSRLYVSASLLEGCPLTPLEAMACGCPVVTTRIGADEYARHRKNALLIPSRNSNALCKAIRRVLENDKLAGKLRRGGLETAKKFTWARTTDRIEEGFFGK